jgi:hypothetical protein
LTRSNLTVQSPSRCWVLFDFFRLWSFYLNCIRCTSTGLVSKAKA